MSSLRVLLLGSTQGSVLSKLLPRLVELPVSVVAGVSDRRECGFLSRLRQEGIPCHALLPAGRARANFDEVMSALLDSYWPDVILMTGYMRIVGPAFVERWRDRVFNVHPSLLPRHQGLMDLAVHQAVIDAGETVTGCSVHRVTEVVDGGEVLVQRRCPVYASDDAVRLKARVQALEVGAWYELLQGCCDGVWGL